MGLRASPGIIPSPTRTVPPTPQSRSAFCVTPTISCAGFPTREPSPPRLQNASCHTLNHPRYKAFLYPAPLLSAVPLLVLSHDDAGSCWRVSLRFASDLAALEPLAYLKPFLGVIRSEETSGPITGVALSSVNKFLSYGFIRTHTRTLTRTRAHAHAPSLSLFAAYASG